MEYEHKGVKISFNANTAEFSATVAGKFKESTSLSAIKKAIDNAEKNAFQCFNALVRPHWELRDKGTHYVECRVVGIARERGRRSSWRKPQAKWLIDGRGEVSEVWVDTPENRAAIDAYAAAVKAEKARQEQESERLRAMDDEIKCVPFPADPK